MADFNGGPDNDSYTGGDGADTINGNGGNDTLAGGGGGDTINGGDGNDTIYTALVSPPWDRGYVSFDATPPQLDIGAERDTVTGGDGSDTIYGGYGDNLDGGTGTDALLISLMGATSGVTVDFSLLDIGGTISLGGGTITGFEGVSWIEGSNFADTITGPGNNATPSFGPIYGRGGDDHLTPGYYTGIVHGNEGNDTIDLAGAVYGYPVYGDEGDDTIINVRTAQIAYGGIGNDTITGSGILRGQDGNDILTLVGQSPDPIYGGNGDDTLNGSASGNNTLVGEAGSDTLNSGDNDDRLFTGGVDQGYSNAFISDFEPVGPTLDNGAEHDTVNAGGGNDFISAGYGDSVDGGTGNNSLTLSLAGAAAGVTFSTAGLAGGGSVVIGGGTIKNITTLRSLYGSAFADTLTVGTMPTVVDVHAGAGNDTVSAAASTMAVTLFGEDGNDTLDGGSGNDQITGGAGMDTIHAGGGDDTIFVADGSDIVAGETYDGGGGTNDFIDTGFADTIHNLSLTTISNIEGLRGTVATVTAAQLDAFTQLDISTVRLSGGGTVSMAGVTTARSTTFYLADSATTFDLTGYGTAINIGATVYGGTANDTITGTQTVDTLYGQGGDDVIRGGGSDDTMFGGDGVDHLFGDDGNDSVRILSNSELLAGDSFDGGAGNDVLQVGSGSYLTGVTDISALSLTSVEYLWQYQAETIALTTAQLDGFTTLNASSLKLTTATTAGLSFAGVTGTQQITFTLSSAGPNVFDLTGYAGPAATIVVGGTSADTITGTTGADNLSGGDGNDILTGGIDLGGYVDVLFGGNGDDLYLLTGSALSLFENPNAGYDTVRAGFSLTLPDSFEQLELNGSGNFTGTGNELSNVIIGNAGANTLTGLGGNDTLDGRGGTDTLIGGFGNDLYLVEIDDIVTENASQGIDTIQLSNVTGITLGAPYILAANVETLILIGNSFNAHGNALSNTITGSNVSSLLYGEDGDDNITAGSSQDYLYGGNGNDTLTGGLGTDQFYGGTGNDVYFVDGQSEVVFENANEGIDLVNSSNNFYLYANIENLTLIGTGNVFAVGNEMDNTIYGNAGDNTLLGGAGRDTINGFAGTDVIYGEDGQDLLAGGDGNDYIAGGNGDDVMDGGNGGDSLYGEAGNDTLTGGSDFVFDQLVGGDGNDILRGDSGFADYDYLYGNVGDDSFYVDTGDDLTFEQAGEGIDTVYANVPGANNGVYLYANIENLVLLGATAFGVGNELDNAITGNAMSNTLLGGAGADTINGKGGNDIVFGQAGADKFVFEHGTGVDTIGDFAAGTDRIDLTAIGYSWQQVQNSLHENGGNTAIDLGNGDIVILNGVTVAQLSQSDFILAISGSAVVSVEPVELTVVAPARLSIHGADHDWVTMPVF